MQVQAGLSISWERTPPPVLYHYTTQDGFLGILETGNIWASKIQYLNDYEEFKIGLSVAEQIAKTRNLSLLSAHLEGIRQTNICVCSFSEEGDLLSQWRGYCPEGIGFSVGFDSESLRSLADSQNFLLGPCEYDVELRKTILESLIDAEVRRFGTTQIEHSPGRLAKLIAVYAAVMKHASFSEEREWRLVSAMIDSRHRQFGFRKGPSVIVPYFKFNLNHESKPLPIKHVIIGPTPHPDLALDSVSMLLGSKGITERSATNSVIPYRNW